MNQAANSSIFFIENDWLNQHQANQNSTWITNELVSIGIQINKQLIVENATNDILQLVDDEKDYSNILILTSTDETIYQSIIQPLMCYYFHSCLNEPSQKLNAILKIINQENNAKKITNDIEEFLATNCTSLIQKIGNTSGLLFYDGKNIFILLPPHSFDITKRAFRITSSMIVKNQIAKKLLHRTLTIYGLSENEFEIQLNHFAKILSPSIHLSYTSNLHNSHVKLSTTALAEYKLNDIIDILKSELKDIIILEGHHPLEKILAHILSKHQLSVSTAESCTGGMISSRLTSVSGASQYFKGGIVAYSEFAKKNMLDVSSETISQFTVVSEKTVIEMANHCRMKFQTDFSLSISGYLEDGDHQNEVWIGVSSKNKNAAHQIFLKGNRKLNTELASELAIDFLITFILKQI
ncbi:MAG TPA: nicotinamide-nucleotide amidohydrolase family protein [Chitinophagaceae bacterium]|nr:MAG: competence/damage-inducible protein CinA [Bacteroidetes bacterium OLB11]HMN33078.1 nicotinamide-nucleotide amidohydrolase family protein [Chitinophagaceae bacterium]